MRSGSVCAATLLLALPRSASASVPPGLAGAVRRAVESGDNLNEIWLASTTLEPVVEDNEEDEDLMLNEALGNALTNTFGESEFDEKDDKVVTPVTTTTTASWAASRNEEWWKDPLAMFEDDEMTDRPRTPSAVAVPEPAAPDPTPQEIETESVPEAVEAVPVPDVVEALPVETQSVAVTAPPDVVATPAVVPPPATVPPVAVDKVQETPPPVAPADQVEPQSRVSIQRPALFRRPSFTPVSRLLSGLAQHNATATTNHLLLALAVTKSSWMLVQYLRDKFLDPPPLEPSAARRQDDDEDEYEEEPLADPLRTSRHAAAVHPGGDSAVEGDYHDLDQEQDDDASLDKRGTSEHKAPEDFESDRSTTSLVTRRKSSRSAAVSTEMAAPWWRRILGPRMPSARTLLLQIQELHAQVDQALLSRAAMEQAYEKCSAELQQRQTELTSLQQTIEYLQKQVADQLETRKRAIRLERKKAKEEMTKMKKTMVKVVERERQTMRDEFMKQAADLEALMRQEYEKTESSPAPTRKNEGRSGNITFQLQPTSKSA
jgi:hypothetical protein